MCCFARPLSAAIVSYLLVGVSAFGFVFSELNARGITFKIFK